MSAASYTSDWALIRYSTAIPDAGIPPSISAAAAAATDLASVGSSGCSVNVLSGPSGSTAVSRRRYFAACPEDPAMIRFARVTTCGVDR